MRVSLSGRTRITADGGRHSTAGSGDGFTFYLGTHEPSWLNWARFPLFVSHRRLCRYRRLPVARCGWALDSGAFTELSIHGRWMLSPEEYVAAVRRYRQAIGHLVWAAPQDWMCEPSMVARTGLSVAEHQRRTVSNFLLLRQLAPDLPFIPVIQGWRESDYLRCVDAYAEVAVDLSTEPLVGIGSVCRRQGTTEIAGIVARLHGRGLRLYAFGVKTAGLRRYGRQLVSADSMAWSFHGRFVHGCQHRRTGQRAVASEANCPRFAQQWRRQVLSAAGTISNLNGEQHA